MAADHNERTLKLAAELREQALRNLGRDAKSTERRARADKQSPAERQRRSGR